MMAGSSDSSGLEEEARWFSEQQVVLRLRNELLMRLAHEQASCMSLGPAVEDTIASVERRAEQLERVNVCWATVVDELEQADRMQWLPVEKEHTESFLSLLHTLGQLSALSRHTAAPNAPSDFTPNAPSDSAPNAPSDNSANGVGTAAGNNSCSCVLGGSVGMIDGGGGSGGGGASGSSTTAVDLLGWASKGLAGAAGEEDGVVTHAGKRIKDRNGDLRSLNMALDEFGRSVAALESCLTSVHTFQSSQSLHSFHS